MFNNVSLYDDESFELQGVHEKSCQFVLATTTSNLHQIQKGRTVLKSAGSEDFKTVLDFENLPSRS